MDACKGAGPNTSIAGTFGERGRAHGGSPENYSAGRFSIPGCLFGFLRAVAWHCGVLTCASASAGHSSGRRPKKKKRWPGFKSRPVKRTKATFLRHRELVDIMSATCRNLPRRIGNGRYPLHFPPQMTIVLRGSWNTASGRRMQVSGSRMELQHPGRAASWESVSRNWDRARRRWARALAASTLASPNASNAASGASNAGCPDRRTGGRHFYWAIGRWAIPRGGQPARGEK